MDSKNKNHISKQYYLSITAALLLEANASGGYTIFTKILTHEGF